MDEPLRISTFHHIPIRIVVCVSGAGSTLRNLVGCISSGTLPAQISCVIASRAGIGGIDLARSAGLGVSVVERRGKSLREFSDQVFDVARKAQCELVVLAGFLSLVQIPSDFRFRVINIHPSLIPAFCGKGFHGRAVHEAVLASGVKLTGCTVHFADDNYDTGPIIVQRAVPVLDDDTELSLAQRVFLAECVALPEAIGLFAAGRLSLEGRRVRVAEQPGPTPG